MLFERTTLQKLDISLTNILKKCICMHTLANGMQPSDLHGQLWVCCCCCFFFQVSRYLTQLHCFTDLWKSDLCVSFINISNEQADFFNHWNLGTKHSAKCFSEFHATSLKSMACLAGIQGRIWTIINNWNPDKDTQKKQFYKWSTLCKSNCEQEQPHLEKNKWFTLCYFCIGFYCLY